MALRPFDTWARKHLVTLTVIAILSVVAFGPTASWGQDEQTKSGSGKNSSSQDDSSGIGFSIESEMLTYRALESNSEAVACDVAAYLNGTVPDFKSPPTGAVCGIRPAASTKPGLILAPFGSSVFEAFQLWRAELEILREIRSRAAAFCPDSAILETSKRQAGASSAAAAGAAKSATDLLGPVGSVVDVSKTILGLFAKVHTETAVAGTIKNQAFIDAVGRELRSLNVSVLMPGSYTRFSFSSADVTQSPFLVNINKLAATYECLAAQQASSGPSARERSRMHRLVQEIDAYTAVLRGAEARVSGEGVTADQPEKDGPKRPEGTTPIGVSAPPTLLMSILSGDDLARTLGVDPDTGVLPAEGQWRHVLLLRALESGGTIGSTKSGFGGSKDRYDGGAVGTYALFSLDGHLECSGNVYDFAGPIPAETFQRDLRAYRPDPQSQSIFQRGGCSVH
jgi:hypothetical protein